MPDETEETREIAISALESALKAAEAKQRDVLTDPKEFFLVINGVARHVRLGQELSIILGRTSDPDEQTFDLSPFGAADHGVSARHVRLQVKGNCLYVTDLESKNGTRLGGKQLEPGKRERVRNGDTLTLARLALRILF